MGFYTKKAGEVGEEEWEGEEDENGEFIEEAEPGVFGKLPAGWDLKEFNPTFPNGDIAPFSKLMLRGGCSGLGVSYHSVSNDLTDVNFSSIRTGVLDSRDNYRDLQGFTSEAFLDRVAESWLLMALLKQTLGSLDVAEFDRLHVPTWRGRGWDWVNPLQDQAAAEKALKSRTKTLARVLADQGEDLEEHLEQLEEEKQLAAQFGIDLDTIKDGGKANAQTQKPAQD
jgi:lambda family phage portal protein